MLRKIDDVWTSGEFIFFYNRGKLSKQVTNTYMVVTQGNDTLGQVKWFPRWRCFCFFPRIDTIYEKTCLRDIAEFCEVATKERKDERERVVPQRTGTA